MICFCISGQIGPFYTLFEPPPPLKYEISNTLFVSTLNTSLRRHAYLPSVSLVYLLLDHRDEKDDGGHREDGGYGQ